MQPHFPHNLHLYIYWEGIKWRWLHYLAAKKNTETDRKTKTQRPDRDHTERERERLIISIKSYFKCHSIVFLNDLTYTFAYILSKVGIHVPCNQSRSFLEMTAKTFQLFSKWRNCNRSIGYLISDYLNTWHIQYRTPARRIGNIVLMTQEQDQTLQTKLDSYNDVRDFWSFANPGAYLHA